MRWFCFASPLRRDAARRRHAVWALWVALAAGGLSSAHGETGGCAASLPARGLPQAALCLQRAKIAAGIDAPNELFARAKAQLDAGHLEEAERSLDCADAVIGGDGDAQLRYELVRRRGILDFRREWIPQALSRFECAVTLSTALGDRAATARDLSNVGAALRRLGDFRGALRSLTASLDIQRGAGQVSGAVLNNIADVYRELRETDTAMRYYHDALAFYRGKGEPIEAAHVLETMAEVALDTGDARQASAWLQEALAAYRSGGNRVYELRVHDGLTRVALAQGDIAQAQRWTAGALALADTWKLPLPPALQLQIARTAQLSGRTAAAATRLREALASVPEGDPMRVSLLEQLATAQERAGDAVAANATLRDGHAKAIALADAQHDRQLDWLRVRFESAEQQRTIAALESENRLRRAQFRQRTLLLWFAIAVAVAAMLGFWLLQQRRRQRERLREQARRVRHEEELARYRREADALAEDRSLLQALLDSRDDALCLLDADGQLLAVNRAGRLWLGYSGNEALVGQPLSAFVGEAGHAALSSALERMEDSAAQRLEIAARAGAPLLAKLESWSGGDGLVLLAPLDREDVAAPVIAGVDAPVNTFADTDLTADHVHEADDDGGESSMRDAFRRTLVELMLASVDAWERATGTGRLEFAEKSRIWRVNIDDGRLRARALERYLSLSKLPRNPRWRDVLRSAYFVLGRGEELPAQTRAALQSRVDAVLAYTRRDALV
ncbi:MULTISPECIES: PAS domain-containing protein [unclassified Lysobacter]|uniref:PAS domain-containing protein n=1 Tax=unclassified Lysobacter TaxID=2635362 RepID=UPI001BE81024|nr:MULTISPECIES: PAS domain-containing protein [unclassified Lysobacter]MBT2750099.1 tetratricopeptide repeat protein [Lysobacter sp. ISL-50]MBT2775329.1 tetratricopeptide repeat protein [Lysobacter sp. ISL-54]MBT2783452.1 tetratricopeptide repeat protein [Lysobacter sp. ISL-52]